MDPAAVVLRQVDAGIVRTALEHEALAIRRDVRLTVDEILFGHPEKLGYAPDLGIAYPNDPVLDPTTRPATLTVEIHGDCFVQTISIPFAHCVREGMEV